MPHGGHSLLKHGAYHVASCTLGSTIFDVVDLTTSRPSIAQAWDNSEIGHRIYLEGASVSGYLLRAAVGTRLRIRNCSKSYAHMEVIHCSNMMRIFPLLYGIGIFHFEEKTVHSLSPSYQSRVPRSERIDVGLQKWRRGRFNEFHLSVILLRDPRLVTDTTFQFSCQKLWWWTMDMSLHILHSLTDSFTWDTALFCMKKIDLTSIEEKRSCVLSEDPICPEPWELVKIITSGSKGPAPCLTIHQVNGRVIKCTLRQTWAKSSLGVAIIKFQPATGHNQYISEVITKLASSGHIARFHEA